MTSADSGRDEHTTSSTWPEVACSALAYFLFIAAAVVVFYPGLDTGFTEIAAPTVLDNARAPTFKSWLFTHSTEVPSGYIPWWWFSHGIRHHIRLAPSVLAVLETRA